MAYPAGRGGTDVSEDELGGLLEHLSERYLKQGYRSLSGVEQVCVCVDQIDFEVHLGGFLGYFHNSAGDLATDTVSALEAVGATSCADALRRARTLFPGGQPSSNRQKRVEQMAAFDAGQE
jgi:hypothetical protein